MNTTHATISSFLREITTNGESSATTRRRLVHALQNTSFKGTRNSKLWSTLRAISRTEDFAWVIGAAYWRLRRRDGSLPAGTIFTPPALANSVVNRLRRKVEAVDLGAGTGMLTMMAAKRGFKVTAVEQDQEMATVIDGVARWLRVRDRITLVIGDALSYQGSGGQQIMSNPPYTRHHAIPAHEKRALLDLSIKWNVSLPLTAGYHAYFMLYAWNAEWSEKEVLLVPTNWIDAKYGQALRERMLSRGLQEIAVVQNGDGKPAFDNALTTACLVTTQKKSRNSVHKTKTVVHPIGNGSHNGYTRFAQLLAAKIQSSRTEKSQPVRSRTLGDIFRIRRGIATGANAFFVLTQNEAQSLEIPKCQLTKIVRRLGQRNSEIQYLWTPGESVTPASKKRIKLGEKLGVHKGYLCSHRKPWWHITIPDPPNYLLSYMGRNSPKLQNNEKSFLTLNNIHGMYIRDGVFRSHARRIASWLRSPKGQRAMMSCARHYEGGLWKIEPGDIEKLKLPKELWY
jgi:adenine-specific DNA-methyltransferase